MQQYYPNVQCWPPTRPSRALNTTACQILLNGMLTTTSTQIFGERGTPGVEVPLTQRFSSGRLPTQDLLKALHVSARLTVPTANGDCSIAILMDGPPVLLTWHDIWGAAVAVAGMCVSSGKLGTAILQCRSRDRSRPLAAALTASIAGNSKIDVAFGRGFV